MARGLGVAQQEISTRKSAATSENRAHLILTLRCIPTLSTPPPTGTSHKGDVERSFSRTAAISPAHESICINIPPMRILSLALRSKPSLRGPEIYHSLWYACLFLSVCRSEPLWTRAPARKNLKAAPHEKFAINGGAKQLENVDAIAGWSMVNVNLNPSLVPVTISISVGIRTRN
ncbi:hypothetical protein K474DRAFT_1669998 [Panus rudis PR-1116 ss-1]|nr:hypothetical protein K474DRAFT_1669998 [Panus rudis PR-1116 ss-1]